MSLKQAAADLGPAETSKTDEVHRMLLPTLCSFVRQFVLCAAVCALCGSLCGLEAGSIGAVDDLVTQPTAGLNPFSPGFGRTPHAVVGRDDLLDDLIAGLGAGPGDPRFASLLMGVRGSGKTVVLNELEDRAARQGTVILSVDGSSKGLPERIVNSVGVALDDHTSIGTGDGQRQSSRLESLGLRLGVLAATWSSSSDRQQRPITGMGDALMTLTQAAEQAGTSVLLTVDELHAIDRDEARRLAGDIQHVAARAGLPLAFVGAGLLEMSYTLLADTKITFMQRCERYEMPALDEADIAVGLRLPVRDAGGDITDDALRVASSFVIRSGHSPYRLQILGHTMWRMAGAPHRAITGQDAQASLPAAQAAVDRSISGPAWHELSQSAQSYLAAVAATHAETSPSDLALRVAERNGLSPGQAGRIRRRLVVAGYLTQAPGGAVDLTDLVPASVIDEQAPEEVSHYATPGSHDAENRANGTGAGSLCRRWMPRARAHCVLPEDHAGRCRSRL